MGNVGSPAGERVWDHERGEEGMFCHPVAPARAQIY